MRWSGESLGGAVGAPYALDEGGSVRLDVPGKRIVTLRVTLDAGAGGERA